MSGYSYNVLTPAGAALIAQATATNQIVFVGALSKASAAESAEDLATKGADWYDGKTGEIVAVSATENRARAVAAWRNAGVRQAALSLCVTARLASQADSDAVPTIAMSDPDATVELPGAGDTTAGIEVPFVATINAAGTVAVTPGAAASLADLERFVSAHKAGDPLSGDEQTIIGNKTFESFVTFESEATFELPIEVYRRVKLVGDEGDVPGVVSETYGGKSSGQANASIRAGYDSGALAKIGCAAEALGTNYQGLAELNVAQEGQTSCGIALEYNSAHYSAQNPHEACLATIYCGNRFCTYNGETFRIRGVLELNDGTNNGTLSVAGNAATISTKNFIVGSGRNSIIQANTIRLTTDPTDDSAFVYWDDDNHIIRTTNAIVPDDDYNIDLGAQDLRWDSIYTVGMYAEYIHGCIPRPSNDTTEPDIGTIFFAQIVFHSSVTANAKIGATASVGQGLGGSAAVVDYIRQAAWDSALNEWQSGGSAANFSTGYYKLLSGLVVTNGTTGFALVMRIN